MKTNSKCCGYGTDAANRVTGYDCAMIPSATQAATGIDGMTVANGAAYGFCGGELGRTADATDTKTICCKS